MSQPGPDEQRERNETAVQAMRAESARRREQHQRRRARSLARAALLLGPPLLSLGVAEVAVALNGRDGEDAASRPSPGATTVEAEAARLKRLIEAAIRTARFP